MEIGTTGFNQFYKTSWMIILQVTVAFILIARLAYLQIWQGEELFLFSQQNHLREIKIQAPRGLFFDRNGIALVTNRIGYEAIIESQFVQNWDILIAQLANILNFDKDSLNARVRKKRQSEGYFSPIKVKEHLTFRETFRLKLLAQKVSGIDVREKIIRYYPLSTNGSQLFGYVGEISKSELELFQKIYPNQYSLHDVVGKFGLEELLEPYLHGQNGYRVEQVDAYGRRVTLQEPFKTLIKGYQTKKAISGKHVQLTIDVDLQRKAFEAFVKNNAIGAAVVINRNGEILAWVSVPGFDPNELVMGLTVQRWQQLALDPKRPLRNKVIQDHYPPGSTFKPFVALAALQEKIITEKTLISCPGFITFGNRRFHDHKKEGFGLLNVLGAIERSSNVFFYKMGIALGVDKIHKWASLFGFGELLPIELKRQSPGVLPSSERKLKTTGQPWHPGENLSLAIGQGGIVVTPLQLALAYLTIGLEGQMMRPFVVRKIFDDYQVYLENQPQVLRQIDEIQRENFKIIKEALRRVVNEPGGTARRTVRLLGVQIAGKTGTSQVRSFSQDEIYQKCENKPFDRRHHGWFAGFAPFDEPEIALAVLVEHGCAGSRSAGPIAREIFLNYFQKYHPDWNVKVPSEMSIKTDDSSPNTTQETLE